MSRRVIRSRSQDNRTEQLANAIRPVEGLLWSVPITVLL